jgi:hypothetical protein
MDGVGGLRNWRWIFVLEGVGTVLMGIIAFFLIPDFPEDASWLSQKEREYVEGRTGRYHGSAVIDEEEHHAAKLSDVIKDVGLFFTDPMRVMGAFMFWGKPPNLFTSALTDHRNRRNHRTCLW